MGIELPSPFKGYTYFLFLR